MKITTEEKNFIVRRRKVVSAKFMPTKDTIYYRGSEYPIKNISGYTINWYSQHNKDWSKVDKSEIPKEVLQLFNKKKIYQIDFLDLQVPFKKSRTYSGMSNWGFGTYFAPTLSFASRYGDYITGVKIDPKVIVQINDRDFAKAGFDADDKINNTPGGKLKIELLTIAGTNWRDQARVFYKAVKKVFGRDKRALLVNDLQIVVYNADAIKPLFNFKIGDYS